ncbi:hypothetical protein BJ165DRAFT_1039502 [Panaeolus papilionaceus]|nr:hypothetical protein BJ165DRAFT_1039502 [Panaeolus papilionaceus]
MFRHLAIELLLITASWASPTPNSDPGGHLSTASKGKYTMDECNHFYQSCSSIPTGASREHICTAVNQRLMGKCNACISAFGMSDVSSKALTAMNSVISRFEFELDDNKY